MGREELGEARLRSLADINGGGGGGGGEPIEVAGEAKPTGGGGGAGGGGGGGTGEDNPDFGGSGGGGGGGGGGGYDDGLLGSAPSEELTGIEESSDTSMVGAAAPGGRVLPMLTSLFASCCERGMGPVDKPRPSRFLELCKISVELAEVGTVSSLAVCMLSRETSYSLSRSSRDIPVDPLEVERCRWNGCKRSLCGGPGRGPPGLLGEPSCPRALRECAAADNGGDWEKNGQE